MAMVRRIFAIMAALSAMLATSCDNFQSSLKVLTGNVNHARGKYQKSILNYLHGDDLLEDGRDVVLYNLANVYYSLGEENAAMQTWSLAKSITSDKDVLYRIAFNQGVFFYQRGRFHEAYSSFRRALKLNPADVDTKINLEDSLLRISKFAGAESSGLQANGLNSGPAGSAVSRKDGRLLDYVRRKEVSAWQEAPVESEAAEEDW